MPDQNIVETAQKLIASGLAPVIKDGIAPFVVVPIDYELKSLEPLFDTPRRKRANPTFTSLESFIRYANDFKADGTPRIFADAKQLKLTAIFDYHQPGDGGARNCDHRASFSAQVSEPWKLWTTIDHQWLPQKQFANFLEDNASDISSPPSAEMLDVASTLQATISVNFRKGVRLDNSTEQIIYEQNIDAKAGQGGELIVPRQFTLFIPVFYHQSHSIIDMRLRYRIVDGDLSFNCLMSQRTDILDKEWERIVNQVTEKTGIAPLMGSN